MFFEAFARFFLVAPVVGTLAILIVSLSSRPRNETLPTPRAASRDPEKPASAAISSAAAKNREIRGVHPHLLKNGPDSLKQIYPASARVVWWGFIEVPTIVLL
jgi:hypothetical protein